MPELRTVPSGRALAHVAERPRQVPVVDRCDVLVVGGGSAGVTAAVAAARTGADVILVERYGYLGGLATGGLIILLLTLDDGAGHQVIAGLCQETVDRLQARGAAYFPARAEWGSPDPARVDHFRRWGLVWGPGPHAVRYSVAFEPEELKQVANGLLVEAGVRLRLHTLACGVVAEGGRISHVLFESKAGREAIAAQVVIDTTGDGDLFAYAGESYEKAEVHPWLWFRMGNVQRPDDAIRAAQGRFFQTLGGFFMNAIGAGRTLMPWGAADAAGRRIDATRPEDLTYAEIECRRLVMKEADRLRAEVPGFEQAYLHDIAVQLGITESRRLSGAYVLGKDDVARPCGDAVGVTGNWTRYGQVYQIPYRCLQTRGVQNLLVAGRCISVDSRVHHSTKEIPACMVTGQAAGTAAALAAGHTGGAVGAVSVAELQRCLRAAGAVLDLPSDP